MSRPEPPSGESDALASPAAGVEVSVVLRTYDHAPFIAQAIESVLLQRAPFAFELILAEDCSRDGTRAIVQEYARRHPNLIRTVLPEHNLGHGEIFRLALQAVSGRYVAYLDGDDYWTSATKLARQVEFLEANPECRSCFHDVSLIYDAAGLPSGNVSPRLGEARFGLQQILMECFVPAPAMVFRKEVSDELPAWVFESAWIDWLIHIRAALSGWIGYLPQPLAAYRVHRGGMFSALDRVSQLEEDVRFYRRLIPELPEHEGLLGRCIENRHAQLAIEKLGAPYDSCVVLVDPARELRPYFNGRHARNLPRREGREVTELEAIREAARELPTAVGDYGPRVDPAALESGCYVVMPRSAAQWLRDHPELSAYLDRHAQVAWESEWVSVYELAPLTAASAAERSRALRRIEVSMLLPSAGDPAGFLDLPRSHTLLPAHAVAIAGWVIADGATAEAIEFELDGEIVWRAPVHLRRADVLAAFPDAAVERCGFQTTFNAQELPLGAATRLVAVFADASRMPLAMLSFMDPAEAGAAAAASAGAAEAGSAGEPAAASDGAAEAGSTGEPAAAEPAGKAGTAGAAAETEEADEADRV